MHTKSPSPIGDEVCLQKLCYMATEIRQPLIGPTERTFILRSGNASLKFPSGAAVKETSVHYAITLHGPFVFLAGCKLGSVLQYTNNSD